VPVNAVRHRLRACIWLALVAVVALAVVPTLSRAWGLDVGGVKAPALVEVCTIDGLRMVPSDEGQLSSHTPAHHADVFERCAHCVLGAAPLALPPAAPAWRVSDPRAQALPALFLQAPHTLPVWAVAQPRAPPSHS